MQQQQPAGLSRERGALVVVLAGCSVCSAWKRRRRRRRRRRKRRRRRESVHRLWRYTHRERHHRGNRYYKSGKEKEEPFLLLPLLPHSLKEEEYGIIGRNADFCLLSRREDADIRQIWMMLFFFKTFKKFKQTWCLFQITFALSHRFFFWRCIFPFLDDALYKITIFFFYEEVAKMTEKRTQSRRTFFSSPPFFKSLPVISSSVV